MPRCSLGSGRCDHVAACRRYHSEDDAQTLLEWTKRKFPADVAERMLVASRRRVGNKTTDNVVRGVVSPTKLSASSEGSGGTVETAAPCMQADEPYSEVVLATVDARRPAEVDNAPPGVPFVTTCKTFPATAAEVQDYTDRVADYNEKRQAGGGERAEFNKASVTKRVKAAQRTLLPDHNITNAHVLNADDASWCRLNRNPLNLSLAHYRSLWCLGNGSRFTAILRTMPLVEVHQLRRFMYHRFDRTSQGVQAVLVTVN